MLSWIFRALRLGGVLTSPQAAPSGLQTTPPNHRGMENPRKPGSPDFILILLNDFKGFTKMFQGRLHLNNCKYPNILHFDSHEHIILDLLTVLFSPK